MSLSQTPTDDIDGLGQLDPLDPDRTALARVLEVAYQRGLAVRAASAAGMRSILEGTCGQTNGDARGASLAHSQGESRSKAWTKSRQKRHTHF